MTMKKTFAVLAAAAALCLAGCVKEEPQETDAILPGEEVTLSVTQCDFSDDSQADSADTADTKTVVRNDKEVWWQYNDKIAVFMSTNSEGDLFTSTLGSGQYAKTSYFTGKISKTGSKYYVGYPYSGASFLTSSKTLKLTVQSTQITANGTFRQNLLPAYGSFTSSKNSFTMKPAAGGLKFRLSRSDIMSVTFEGNNNEKIAGTISVNKLDNSSPSISRDGCTSTSIYFKYNSGNLKADTDYYIVIPPCTFSKGFTITLTDENGGTMVVKSTKSRTVKAGRFGTLAKPLNEYAAVTAEAIDLGLPSGVKWASCNLGADSPEGYGDYYAWGETSTKDSFGWNSYKWGNERTALTKYNYSSDFGTTVDHKRVLDLADDAANAKWGGYWRIPTDDDWKELSANTTREWTDDYNGTGIKGVILTSTVDGYTDKSLFFPASGYNTTGVNGVGSNVRSWSSNIHPSMKNGYGPADAITRLYGKTSYFYEYTDRAWGLTIRPVYGKMIPVTGLSLSSDMVAVKVGNTVSCEPSFTPADATDKSLLIVVEDEAVATCSIGSDKCLKIKGVAAGTTTLTVYASSGVSVSCPITVYAPPVQVDLGLPSGVKWAEFNAGAGNSWDYGFYYAWGETAPKESYSWSNYKWGGSNSLSKYNYSSDFGSTVDNLGILDVEDDAARALYGSNWRMPTLAEVLELYANTTKQWTSNYNGSGVCGIVLTSTVSGYTDKKIFFPAGGYKSDDTLDGVGTDVYLLTSNLDMNNYGSGGPFFTRVMYASGSTPAYSCTNRCHGVPVRPVYGNLKQVSGLSVSGAPSKMNIGSSTSCNVSFTPSNATDKILRIVSSDKTVLTCTQQDDNLGSLSLNALANGEATVTVYASSGVSASFTVKVFTEPQMVDLGLSVKWASLNLGADLPGRYGNYYAWGEAATKDSYSWNSYLWGGSSTTLTKYNLDSTKGVVDYRRTLDPADDAAQQAWGDDWRVPTLDEWNELKNTSNCTWTWTQQNGYYGYKVTSKKSGYTSNSIFLPAAGAKDGSSVSNAGTYGEYWTATLYPTDYSKAYRLDASKNTIQWSMPNRYMGCSIRPVSGKLNPATGITAPASVTLEAGKKQAVTVTVSPDNADDKSVAWVSSDPSVATYDGYYINGLKYGTATITFYTHNGLSATCNVTVNAVPEAVDLGLSVKWASFNIGSGLPEEKGDFFAWGETAPKASYTWNNYLWSGSGSVTLTKYNQHRSEGLVDYKFRLDPEDDAARANWGSKWRIPTDEEWEELRKNTNRMWTDDYNGTGQSGIILTSKVSGYTDKSIFLPASSTSFGFGYYLSSIRPYENTNTTSTRCTCCKFYSTSMETIPYDRCVGMSVRAVYADYVPVSSVSLPSSIALPVGTSFYEVQPDISPAGAYKRCRFTLSDTDHIGGATRVDNTSIILSDAGAGLGSATLTVYTCNGLSAKCTITLTPPLTSLGATFQSVDLGLSVKWATFNVGATKAEEFGDYYAWSEVEPYYEPGYAYASKPVWKSGYEAGYVASNMRYHDLSRYGAGDASSLYPEDDVAVHNLGGTWRMPTYKEARELLKEDKTEITFESLNGVSGIKVRSKVPGYTDKWIFLPVSGARCDTRLWSGKGYYWTSTGPSSSGSTMFNYTDMFGFDPAEEKITTGSQSPDVGCTIRPVQPK